MSSQKLWLALSITALCATLLFVVGFGYAVRSVTHPSAAGIDMTNEQTESTPAEGDRNEDGLTIVTIGDSLTRGLGDDSGKGYAGLVKDTLTETNEGPVYLIPFAVNGYRSDQLLTDLTEETGIMAAIRQADIILMSIGANDFIQLGVEISPDTVREELPGAINHIERIFVQLTELNPHAKIVYVGLYHPFSELDEEGEAAMLIQEFNQEVFHLTLNKPQITVVPTFDLFYRTSNQFLSSDHFHPNEDGYARIAERVLQVMGSRNGGDKR